MPDRIAEIRARLDAATPGPWPDRVMALAGAMLGSKDADLIAHATADIAWLLDEVERLRKWGDGWQRGFLALESKAARGGIMLTPQDLDDA